MKTVELDKPSGFDSQPIRKWVAWWYCVGCGNFERSKIKDRIASSQQCGYCEEGQLICWHAITVTYAWNICERQASRLEAGCPERG